MAGFASLRVRLVLLAFVATVPAFSLLLHASLEDRRLAIVETQQDALRLAQLAASDHARLVEATRQLLVLLAHLPDIRGSDGTACSALLAELLKERDIYTNLGVVDPQGEIVCSAVPMGGPVNVADRPYFERAVSTRTFAGGEFQIGRITRKPGANFGYPILGPAGDVEAVVFAALDVAWLSELPVVARLPGGATLTLVDRSGTILARYPDPQQWIGQTEPGALMIKADLVTKNEEVLEGVGPDGLPRLYAVTALGEDRFGSGYLTIGIPTAAAVAERDRILYGSLAGLAVVLLLALAACWAFGNLLIVRPMAAVVRAANRLGAGDLSARTGLPGGPGEINQMAQAFDEMGAALEARKAEAEQADRLLRERDEQLRQSQKLESIGRLAGGIAHDFNNLLTAVVGTTEVVRDSLGSGDFRRVQLDHVLQASERGAALVRQLLAFSRQQPLQPVALNLNQVVEATGSLLDAVLGRDVTVSTVLQPGLGSSLADPTQIDQVLLNLAVNARDAMPRGGQLTIQTSEVEVDASFADQHLHLEPGSYVVLSVSDTGEGMDAGTRAHIFEPFFTTKEVGKGTGLGLSTVYGIVKQSGGDIWVYSEPGRGTIFKIYLPRVEASAIPEATPLRDHVLPRGTETILLADDDPHVRAFAVNVLESLGYTVFDAANGAEALQAMDDHGGKIDLLLTDLVMPGFGGPELAGEALRRHPRLRVLYTSGFTRDTAFRERVVATGGFLAKPFTPSLLAQKLRAVLDSPVATTAVAGSSS